MCVMKFIPGKVVQCNTDQLTVYCRLLFQHSVHIRHKHQLACYHIKEKAKGKAIPFKTWTGPKGSRRLRLSDFKTIGTRRW